MTRKRAIEETSKRGGEMGGGGGDKVEAKEWAKVLYERQGYPDHYVPPSFLKELRKNVDLHYYELVDVTIASGRLTQEIGSIIIFIVVFLFLDSGDRTTAIAVCTLIGSITLLLYFSLIFLSWSGDVVAEVKSAVIFLSSGFAVSPVLKTLTETISTDTIYAMVTLMMLVHLVFYDYGVKAGIVSTPISLNAAIFGAVCLASRLSTTYHAFALLVFASDIFVLFTVLRNRLRGSLSKKSQAGITLSIASVSVLGLYSKVSLIYPLLLFILILFVNFIFPFVFFKLQSYKENIYGPWDEAVIRTSPTALNNYDSRSNSLKKTK